MRSADLVATVVFTRREGLSMRTHWGEAVSVLAALAVTSVLVVGPASANSGRAVLAGNVPPWATSANFKQSASSTDTAGFRVYPGWQNQTRLEALETDCVGATCPLVEIRPDR